MIQSDFFGHQGPDGDTADVRAAAAGYGGGVGENLAAGFSTPEDMMDALMASPGHRANILHPDYKSMGVGYAFVVPDPGAVNFNHYWVQNFGLERTSAPNPIEEPLWRCEMILSRPAKAPPQINRMLVVST